MRIDLVTIFPDYFTPLSLSLIGKARQAGLVDVRVHDLRAWATDRHRTVDDTPYGGGAGMVMRPDPWGRALDAVTADPPAGSPDPPAGSPDPLVLVPTPAGALFTQSVAGRLAGEGGLVVACGRYEGIDTRVVDDASTRWRLEEISVGDYVLAGGEAAALVVVEAVTRLLPGVVGNAASVAEESHSLVGGLLEYPVYTKPPTWRGHPAPAVLLSGDHAAVDRWRRDQALVRTAARRPDLLAGRPSSDFDVADLVVLAQAGWRPGVDGRLGLVEP